MGLLERLGLKTQPVATAAVGPVEATGVVSTVPAFTIDLDRLRRLATLIPGPLPIALNGVRVAASIRPQKFVFEGGDETPVTMPRTAFQIAYPDGAVMLDAGLDKATHDSFSPDKPEPYYPDDFARLLAALNAAKLIVLTHFHADHVAGVLTAANFPELAAKSLITPRTARLMCEAPHRPHLKLSATDVAHFNIVDYDTCRAVAPGLVLIKAPGHSLDMQMVYVRLQSGREFLHSIDAGWTLDNIRRIKGKAAPWVKEDVGQVMAQLSCLNGLLTSHPEITVLVTHDNAQFEQLTAAGVIGGLQI